MNTAKIYQSVVSFVVNIYTELSLRVMRTDAAVNSGNSGGGLFDDSGRLIGIVNAKSSNTSDDNIGYAIPSNVATAIADNAIYYSDGTIKRCMLGMKFVREFVKEAEQK